MIRVRLLSGAEVPAGLALSRQAGWNQTEADWRRAIDLQPDGCFAAECDGAVAGTAATCIFGSVAWVALVLVDAAFRRRGIGRALLEYVLDFLDGRRVASVRLDATPLGQPLYEQLGFVEQFRLARFAGRPAVAGEWAGLPVVVVPLARWPELAALDRQVTRADRGRFLLRLFKEQPGEVLGVEGPGGWSGLLAVRAGANALQIGPCLGEAGALLLSAALRRHAGQPIYLDVPLANEAARRLAAGQGLSEQRQLTRMCRGSPVVEQLEYLWASSGPEKG
jgi:GNAT superfamily N-acetyltransferase